MYFGLLTCFSLSWKLRWSNFLRRCNRALPELLRTRPTRLETTQDRRLRTPRALLRTPLELPRRRQARPVISQEISGRKPSKQLQTLLVLLRIKLPALQGTLRTGPAMLPTMPRKLPTAHHNSLQIRLPRLRKPPAAFCNRYRYSNIGDS